MRIEGEWYLCDDGIERPVIRGQTLASDGSWARTLFLLDTGADCTVLNAAIHAALRRPLMVTHQRLGGLGGGTDSVVVETQIRLTRDGGGSVVFRGHYAAVTDLEALDMSVLGRDITGFFAVIVDRPGNVVCLVGQRHQYAIQQP